MWPFAWDFFVAIFRIDTSVIIAVASIMGTIYSRCPWASVCKQCLCLSATGDEIWRRIWFALPSGHILDHLLLFECKWKENILAAGALLSIVHRYLLCCRLVQWGFCRWEVWYVNHSRLCLSCLKVKVENRINVMMDNITNLRLYKLFNIYRTSAACQVYVALTCVIFVLTFGRHSTVEMLYPVD